MLQSVQVRRHTIGCAQKKATTPGTSHRPAFHPPTQAHRWAVICQGLDRVYPRMFSLLFTLMMPLALARTLLSWTASMARGQQTNNALLVPKPFRRCPSRCATRIINTAVHVFISRSRRHKQRQASQIQIPSCGHANSEHLYFLRLNNISVPILHVSPVYGRFFLPCSLQSCQMIRSRTSVCLA